MSTYTTPKGRTFTLIGPEPYTRKDGAKTTLLVWHGACAHPGCEAPVVVKCTEGADPSKSKNFSRAHCETHKLTREEATARWVEACLKTTTKATPAIIAKIRKRRSEGLSVQKIADEFGLSASRVYALLSK